MTPPVPQSPRATIADLMALGDGAYVELVNGEIVQKVAPTFDHSHVQGLLGSHVTRRFARRPGGRWPGGWRIGPEVDVAYDEGNVFRHDLAGWRRERVPEPPGGWPVRIRPDWACEILSPSNYRRDLIDKFRVLQRAGVPHYWVVNPEERTLIVHRLEPAGYLVALTAAAGETVRAEPFDAVELRLDVVFGDADDDE
jgi:Uma2 family endonuclease